MERVKMLLILIVTLVGAPAFTAPYVSYPDFVMMDQQSKYEVVHMVQDYAVESEYQGLIHIKRLNKNKRTSLFDFFIDEAHASLNGHGKPCMYAGWPSVLQSAGNRTVCNNPRRYESAIKRYSSSDETFKEDLGFASDLYNQYRNDILESANSANKKFVQISYTVEDNKLNLDIKKNSPRCNIDSGAVLCNPLVFGKVDGKVMCVPGDTDFNGYNSSFLCERAVNKLKESDKDAYTKLMDGILEEISSNPGKTSLFLATLKDMYDMCMCSQDPDRINSMRINKDYADRLFYSRTCAGIIYQSQTVLEKLYDNQQVSCPMLIDKDNKTEDWLKFADQALNNVRKETENLGHDWIRKLEAKEENAIAEEEAIAKKRDQAREDRGGQFCPIDIEIPVIDPDDETEDEIIVPAPNECKISVAKNDEDDGYKLSFNPGKDEKGTALELSAFTFSPELKFKKNEEGELIAQYKAPKKDRGPAEEDKEAKEAKEDKKKKESIRFEAKIGKDVICHASVTDADQDGEGSDVPDIPDDKKEVKPEDKDTKCSLALSLEPNGDSYTVVAKAKVGDKEIVPGEDGYSITFINTSVEVDPESEVSEENDDDLVMEKSVEDKNDESDKGEKKKKEVITGSELAAQDDSERFSASLPASDKEQKVVALLKGPKSCEAKAEVSAGAKTNTPSGSPQLRQTPKAQRASPMRHMKALKGNY